MISEEIKKLNPGFDDPAAAQEQNSNATLAPRDLEVRHPISIKLDLTFCEINETKRYGFCSRPMLPATPVVRTEGAPAARTFRTAIVRIHDVQQWSGNLVLQRYQYDDLLLCTMPANSYERTIAIVHRRSLRLAGLPC